MSLRSRLEFKELGAEENSDTDLGDLDSVKALTEKLKLQTRRPSYLEWKERLQCQPWGTAEKGQDSSEVQCPNKTKDEDLKGVDVLKGSSSSKSPRKDGTGTLQNICGFDTMDDALDWLRKELVSIKDTYLCVYLICMHHTRARL
ncbi:F167B protein, partial [Polyodon spathula]|nr:F167B protein [Polyodon spathula]